MTADLIRLSEARALILLYHCPSHPDPFNIGPDYFAKAARGPIAPPLAGLIFAYHDIYVQCAYEAERELKRLILEQEIALNGEFNGPPPIMIPPQHATEGEIDIAAETLNGSDFFYKRVWCVTADVLRVTGEDDGEVSPSELPPPSDARSPQGGRFLTGSTGAAFVKRFLIECPNGDMTAARAAAKAAGYIGGRGLIDQAYRNAHGGNVRVGRRPKEKSANI